MAPRNQPPEPHPESVPAIADRLTRTRLAMRLRQAAFCRRVGIGVAAWNNYEQGIRRISVDHALKLCRTIGVTTDWIYRGFPSQLPRDLAMAIEGLPPDLSEAIAQLAAASRKTPGPKKARRKS